MPSPTMPSRTASTFGKLALAAACLLSLPCAFAQQAAGTGPALPPPSLYDDVPPRPAAAAPVPVQPSPPARVEPQAMPPVVQPGTQVQTQPVGVPIERTLPPPTTVQTPRPAAAPVETPQPAAVAPVQTPRPAAAPVEQRAAPAPVASQPMEPQAEEEPWYRRLWPFGRSKTQPAPAAAAPEHAPAPAAAAPAGRGGCAGRAPRLRLRQPQQSHQDHGGRRLREDGLLGHRPLGRRCLPRCDAGAATRRSRCADPCSRAASDRARARAGAAAAA